MGTTKSLKSKNVYNKISCLSKIATGALVLFALKGGIMRDVAYNKANDYVYNFAKENGIRVSGAGKLEEVTDLFKLIGDPDDIAGYNQACDEYAKNTIEMAAGITGGVSTAVVAYISEKKRKEEKLQEKIFMNH